MLPCQNQCASYHEGCHKTCAWWRAFQEGQRAQRQAKKAYLKYYGELCAAIFNTVKVPAGYAAASTAILAFILSYLRGEMTAEKD